MSVCQYTTHYALFKSQDTLLILAQFKSTVFLSLTCTNPFLSLSLSVKRTARFQYTDQRVYTGAFNDALVRGYHGYADSSSSSGYHSNR